MKLRRRQFLQLAATAAALPAVSRIARADTYPNRPVRIVVGFPPGSATDIDMRLIAAPLGQKLGQEVIVDNKPGAGSNLAAEIVSRAAPDGYTLLAMTVTNAVNATLYQNLSFDIRKDIAPVISTFSARPTRWWSIRRSRPRRLPNSSPMPRPIRARSTTPRSASAAPPI